MKKTEEGKHEERIHKQGKSAYFEQNRGQVELHWAAASFRN
jgi:hypothetical protein